MSPAVALLLVRVIDLVATGIELVPELSERKRRYLEIIKACVNEDRDPNQEEWDFVLADVDSVTDELRAIRDAKLAAQGGTT